MKKRALLLVGLAIGLAVAVVVLRPHRTPPPDPKPSFVPSLHPMATWPWPKAARTVLRTGVTHWYETSSEDGTTLDLVEFDFQANPNLRLKLYDQDENDANPHDNLADYYNRSVGQVIRDLNGTGRRLVVAAWNGPFFAYDRSPGMGANGMGRHVGPVVLDGVVRHNVGNPRWTFGVTSDGRFKLFHQPSKRELAGKLEFGAAGLQCLILDGKPLRLEPYPDPDAPLPRQPVPSSPSEAGHIPLVDHMRTSRTSLAWPADSRKLYLLVVNEPDHELGSKLAVKRGEKNEGGWTLADLQRFWQAFGAPNAINSDGGAVTQLALIRQDGRYDMLPPRLTSRNERLLFTEDFEGAPMGGTLMTFFVQEEDRKK